MNELEELKLKALNQEVVFKSVPIDPWAKLKTGAMITTITIMLTMVVMIFWVVFFESPKLMYDNLPFKIASTATEFHPGEIVPLEVKRCNLTKHLLVYDVTRTIHNVITQDSIVLESTRVALEAGCHTSISRLHALPNPLEAGTYVISGVATVPGTINDKLVEFYSEPFKVTQK